MIAIMGPMLQDRHQPDAKMAERPAAPKSSIRPGRCDNSHTSGVGGQSEPAALEPPYFCWPRGLGPVRMPVRAVNIIAAASRHAVAGLHGRCSKQEGQHWPRRVGWSARAGNYPVRGRLFVLVGQKKAVAIAVRNISERRRWSKLQEWLRPGLPD
jgi:hypothetical protein